MTSRPILFNGAMVRALLDGSKTQTRRVVKLTHAAHVKEPRGHRRWHPADPDATKACPYGQPGDQLWVRETWAMDDEDNALLYGADIGTDSGADDWERNRLDGVPKYRWRPSIHMPRAASRITLEITGVRVERLQDIREADAIAEGIEPTMPNPGHWNWKDYLADGMQTHAVLSYKTLWESINGPGSWDLNPWVWVVEFKRIGGDQ